MRSGGLYLAWLVALAATLGSLYFSEVRHFVPCTLCWYQRILMYPLAVVLAIASYRQSVSIRVYVLPLSVLGMGFALYHVLEQHIRGFGAPGLCKAGIPCNLHYIDWLGFITIPLLSLTAFTLVTLLLAALRHDRDARL